nr:cuticle collagen 144-like [Pongo abelii]
MKAPNCGEGQIPSTAGPEGELHPAHPLRTGFPGRNTSSPRQPGDGPPRTQADEGRWCGDQQPGGGIGKGERGAQIPAPRALGWRGPCGVREAPALRPAERDSSLDPAAGGAAPANRAAARPGLTAPRSLGAPSRAFCPHPPNCCRLGPLPLPGTWKPRAREPIPAGDAGPGGRGKPRKYRRTYMAHFIFLPDRTVLKPQSLLFQLAEGERERRECTPNSLKLQSGVLCVQCL